MNLYNLNKMNSILFDIFNQMNEQLSLTELKLKEIKNRIHNTYIKTTTLNLDDYINTAKSLSKPLSNSSPLPLRVNISRVFISQAR